jgi:DNA polymerase-3 subunit alpha
MVYQEQVMQIVHGLGDIPLRRAYTLIKAISKKKQEVINAERPRFIEGAMSKGLSRAQADELFDLILKFAGYGFNKSHSTGYAIIAYQTAYLKTYFPAQYMAAVLTYESGAKKIEDWAPYLEACRHVVYPDHTPERPHVGVEVQPPDINLSNADFSVVFDDDEPRDNLHGHIRFGLGAMKGVGRSAIAGIIRERDENGPFKSIFDFCERVSSRIANKATIEGLVKGGAFDSLHGRESRAAVFAAIDDAIVAGQQAAEDRRSGQMNIFAVAEETVEPEQRAERPLPHVPAWDQMTALAYEKETLGIHVSGHPLDEIADEMARYVTADSTSIEEIAGEASVVLGGILARVRITMVRNGRSAGEKMAMITVQDKIGSVDGVVFSSVFARDAHLLQDNAVVLLVGRVDRSRGSTQLIVDQVLRLEDAPRHLASCLEITFREDQHNGDLASQMRMAAGELQRAGAASVGAAGRPCDVMITVCTAGKRVAMKPSRLRVCPEPILLDRLRDLVGPDHVRIIGGGAPTRSNGGGRAHAGG